jgi:spore germination protein YaaH
VRKNLITIISGILLGFFVGTLFIFSFMVQKDNPSLINPLAPKKVVIGFLPYWLLDTASSDYSKYITTLAYFGLRVDQNGNIQKLLNPQQEEPGWNALRLGKLDLFFNNALKNNLNLSLMITSGDVNSIGGLVSQPTLHAKNLVADLKPLIDKYKFSDINLDIEYTQTASPAARENFTKFISEVKKGLGNSETLTVEISPTDAIRSNLIDPKAMNKIADNVVLMAYDYHSTSSFVTGPVAPLLGAGIMSEYDVTAAIEKSLDLISPQKMILGIPLYGYEWESLNQTPRSAIIPNTGVAASNRRAEELLASCSNCSVALDKEADEQYISYFDQTIGDYHTIFYPDKNSTQAKINSANKFQLEGLALWALGYEGNSILNPLTNYKGE